MSDNPNRPGPDTGIEQPDADPGAANTPRGAPAERPTSSVADRTAPGAPPPAANQGKNEPVPVSPTRPAAQSTTGSADAQAHDAEAAAERQTGGSATQAAQEGRPLAQGKTAGTNPAAQAVVGRAGAPDGEVSPR